MALLLRISQRIDALNRFVGRAVSWLILVAVLVSAGNAVSRKVLNLSSNAMLEVQWYLFSSVFLLCAGYTLLNKEHVRVDLLLSRLSRRGHLIVEIIGTLLFLVPLAVLIMVLSWPPFVDAWTSGEVSANAGGLIRWPVKLLIPVGFALLLLQAASELIKDFSELRQLGQAGSGPRPDAQS